MAKIILKIGYSCNHKCNFCHAELNKCITNNNNLKTIRKIFHIKKNMKNIDTILFSGGEPTIQNNFFKILKLSYSLGFKTGIVTNGSMIYKKEFLNKCMKNNFKYIYLSIHGGTENLHNKMTQTKNSFNQIKKLLENIKGKNIDLSINCVVTKNNINFLEDVVIFIKKYGFTKIKFSLLEPKGLGFFDIEKLFVSPEIVAKEIIKLINLYKNMNISCDGLPLCLIDGYENKISNLQTEKIFYMSETYENKLYNTDYGLREYIDKCNDCFKNNICYGNFKIYNYIYGSCYLKKYEK